MPTNRELAETLAMNCQLPCTSNALPFCVKEILKRSRQVPPLEALLGEGRKAEPHGQVKPSMSDSHAQIEGHPDHRTFVKEL